MFSNKAVGLDQGRSMRDVIPRIDELLADPAANLAREEVRIRRDSVSWLWFVIPTLLLSVMACAGARQRSWDGGTLMFFLAIWLGIVSLILAIGGYWVWPTRLELLLTASGVAIHHGRLIIRAPWALFATSGSALVSPTSFGGKVLTIPVAPEAVPQVELYRDEQFLARGRDVQTRVCRVVSDGEIQLTDRFETNPIELGTLLLMLGNAIARPAASADAPADTAVQAAAPAQAITAVPGAPSAAAAPREAGARWQAVSIDRAGWLRVPLTRLVFPRICCNCCRSTGDVRLRAVDPALPWWFAPLVVFYNDREKLHVQIPWCGTCFHQHRKRWWGGGLYGAIGGAVVGLALGVLLEAPVLQFVLGFFLGVVGMWLGASFADRPPFEAKHHVKEQKIAFRFQNPAFAHELMEAVQKSVEA